VYIWLAGSGDESQLMARLASIAHLIATRYYITCSVLFATCKPMQCCHQQNKLVSYCVVTVTVLFTVGSVTTAMALLALFLL